MPPLPLKNDSANEALQKVLSICWGLIIVSAALLIIYFAGAERYKDILFLDDYFFGIKTDLFPFLYFVDIFVLSSVILLLGKKNSYGLLLSVVWAFINLLENTFDIFTFSSYPHIIIEELMFVIIYSYLLWLSLDLIRGFRNNNYI